MVAGITWAFTIAIACLAFCGKFGGCTIASRLSGFSWREASTIGALMSCKGFVSKIFHDFVVTECIFYTSLVELIVLNVGLQAGILSQRVFSMFVLEALTLTFITTPLVSVLYPPDRRVIAASGGAPPQSHIRGTESGDSDLDDKKYLVMNEEYPWRHRFTVVLDKLEHMPCIMALTQLVHLPVPAPKHHFSPPASHTSPMTNINTNTTATVVAAANTATTAAVTKLSINALRLIELSDRTSAVMKSTSSVSDTLIHTDPLLCIFRMFGELTGMGMGMGMGGPGPEMAIVPYDDLAWNVAEHARRCGVHMVLVPWLLPSFPLSSSLTPGGAAGGDTNEGGTTPRIQKSEHTHNPFELFFGTARGGGRDGSAAQFVRGVFAQCAQMDVALFVDSVHSNTHTHTSECVEQQQQHIFLPFFGGPDDRLALEFVVQLCANPKIGATVVKMEKCGVESGVVDGRAGSNTDPDAKADVNALAVPHQTVTSVCLFPSRCDVMR